MANTLQRQGRDRAPHRQSRIPLSAHDIPAHFSATVLGRSNTATRGCRRGATVIDNRRRPPHCRAVLTVIVVQRKGGQCLRSGHRKTFRPRTGDGCITYGARVGAPPGENPIEVVADAWPDADDRRPISHPFTCHPCQTPTVRPQSSPVGVGCDDFGPPSQSRPVG